MIKKVFFNNNFYTKYNIINFRYLNLCVIKWEPKMVTDLHDHPNTKCNFFLIDGLLQENVYDKEKKLINQNILENPTDNSYIDDEIGFHKVRNVLPKPSYSFHIYRKN